jgi:hypothetical protein
MRNEIRCLALKSRLRVFYGLTPVFRVTAPMYPRDIPPGDRNAGR